MRHKLPESLKMEFINNKIVNTEDILRSLLDINDYDMLEEYYNFLINNIDIKIYDDLEVIVAAIKSRMHVLEDKMNLKKEMEELQNKNEKLRGLSLIENPKELNDVKKDVYYLKYNDKNGDTHLLEIDNERKFLELLTTSAPTMTAEEFYNYLKTRYFNELIKHSLGSDKIDLVTYETGYLIKDKASFKVEKALLDAYLKLNYPNVVPEISIDSNEERIYYVNSIIIKFHEEDGKRKMEIISGDSELKKKEEQEEIKTDEVTNTAYHDKVTDEVTRSDLENVVVETEEVRNIIGKYTTNQVLEKEEKIKVYAYLLNLLDILDNDFALNNEDNDLLKETIMYLEQKDLNSIETEVLNRYNAYLAKEADRLAKENVNATKKEYLLPDALKPTDRGATLSIIVITVTVLIGALIAAIILVN